MAKAIARDGEGATCLLEVEVRGATDEKSARQVARTIAGSSLVKAAIFGRDPNWGRIAAAAGRASVPFDQEDLQIKLGDFLLMENGQPLPFDRAAASAYLKQTATPIEEATDLLSIDMSNDLIPPDEQPRAFARPATANDLKANTVAIALSIGNGSGSGKAWGCDLSYDYVKINAEYTT